MTIKKKKENKKLTVLISGKVDTSTAPQLEEFLRAEMVDIDELILDLEGVDYISSAGLRVILSAQKTMNSLGTLKVAHVNEDVMETFELTGFTGILTII